MAIDIGEVNIWIKNSRRFLNIVLVWNPSVEEMFNKYINGMNKDFKKK